MSTSVKKGCRIVNTAGMQAIHKQRSIPLKIAQYTPP
jgi:hypothetical protein